jgi:hypothetical protein
VGACCFIALASIGNTLIICPDFFYAADGYLFPPDFQLNIACNNNGL